MIPHDLLREMAYNVVSKGDFLMLNVEFIDDRDLNLLPKVADRLLEIEGVSTVIVYGIKGSMVYMVGKSRGKVNLVSKIKKAFPGMGRVKEINGYTIAVIPMGMLCSFHSQEKILRVVDELMNDALTGGEATRGFGTVFDRVADIKNLINLPEHRQVALRGW